MILSLLLLFIKSDKSNATISDRVFDDRLVINPSTFFYFNILNCLFTHISCNIFDNGGAISLVHSESVFNVKETTFSFCNCFQRKGGAMFYQTKSCTIVGCCAYHCYSVYGLFLYGAVDEDQYFNMSAIFNCDSNDSKFTVSTINTFGGTQTISSINSSNNNMNIFGPAGISVMPNDLHILQCSFANNIGNSIITLNYDTDLSIQYNRLIEMINVVNNTLKTDSLFPQAVMVFFIHNCTLSKSIFQRNSAVIPDKFYTLSQAGNVNSLIIDCTFDQLVTMNPMNTVNCKIDPDIQTYNFDLLESCYIPANANSLPSITVIVIVFSLIAITAIILAVALLLKKRILSRKNYLLYSVVDNNENI